MTTNLIEAAERARDALMYEIRLIEAETYTETEELIAIHCDLAAAIEAAKSVEREQLTWKEAVLNELIVCHIYNSSHDNDPRKAMQDAITCNCQIALDPTVSSEAQALIDRGAVESRAEIEAKVLEEAANEIGHCWRCKADDTLNGMAADRRVSKPSARPSDGEIYEAVSRAKNPEQHAKIDALTSILLGTEQPASEV